MWNKILASMEKTKALSLSILDFFLSLGLILIVLKLFFNVNIFGVIGALRMSRSELMGMFIIFTLLIKKT